MITNRNAIQSRCITNYTYFLKANRLKATLKDLKLQATNTNFKKEKI